VILRSTRVDGLGSVRSNLETPISEDAKGAATVVIHVVGFFYGTLNGGFQPGVEL
jgi:hypothetical protein